MKPNPIRYENLARNSVLPREFATPEQRGGLTLFEILLSLAILAAALAAIGQLVSSGVRGAVRAHLHSEAVIRCQNQMAELIALSEPLPNFSEQPFGDDPNWTWSVTSSETQEAGLALLIVTVKHSANNGVDEVSFSLNRMYRDPALSPLPTSSVSTESGGTE